MNDRFGLPNRQTEIALKAEGVFLNIASSYVSIENYQKSLDSLIAHAKKLNRKNPPSLTMLSATNVLLGYIINNNLYSHYEVLKTLKRLVDKFFVHIIKSVETDKIMLSVYDKESINLIQNVYHKFETIFNIQDEALQKPYPAKTKLGKNTSRFVHALVNNPIYSSAVCSFILTMVSGISNIYLSDKIEYPALYAVQLTLINYIVSYIFITFVLKEVDTDMKLMAISKKEPERTVSKPPISLDFDPEDEIKKIYKSIKEDGSCDLETLQKLFTALSSPKPYNIADAGIVLNIILEKNPDFEVEYKDEIVKMKELLNQGKEESMALSRFFPKEIFATSVSIAYEVITHWSLILLASIFSALHVVFYDIVEGSDFELVMESSILYLVSVFPLVTMKINRKKKNV